MALEKLTAPPIVEVVCGVLFEPITAIDPVTLGGYREEIRTVYTGHSLHAPIMSEGGQLVVKGSFPPIRTWFISVDDAWVIQVQWDRFYLNWRARGGRYPQFSDRPGQEGVLSRFMKEFGLFSNFAKRQYGVEPTVHSVELSKVDHFEEGRTWNGLDDLTTMLPWLGPFAAVSLSKKASISARLREERDGGTLTVSVEVAGQQAKLDSRVVNPIGADLKGSFELANLTLNGVFESLIPRTQRDLRFQGGTK